MTMNRSILAVVTRSITVVLQVEMLAMRNKMHVMKCLYLACLLRQKCWSELPVSIILSSPKLRHEKFLNLG